MDFLIPDAEVKLCHLNVRTEKHGSDDVTAVDLTLQWTTSNQQLAQFHPDLIESLYMAEPGQQKRVEGVPAILPLRIFPTSLAALHWTTEATGRRLVIRHGIKADTDLQLDDCTADKFSINPMDGGTVTIGLRVRAICDDERVLGKLGMMLNRTLPMHLASMPELVT